MINVFQVDKFHKPDHINYEDWHEIIEYIFHLSKILLLKVVGEYKLDVVHLTDCDKT